MLMYEGEAKICNSQWEDGQCEISKMAKALHINVQAVYVSLALSGPLTPPIGFIFMVACWWSADFK